MSDLRSEIVNKVLNSWDNNITSVKKTSLSEQVFNYIQSNPSATSVQVSDGTGIEIGRASALMLALYQQGKLDRRSYPNPKQDGKHTNVYAYWTQVDNFTDRGISRKPPKEKKPKKVKLNQAQRIEQDILEPITKPMPKVRVPFDPETFVHGLTLTEVKALHKFLEDYFG